MGLGSKDQVRRQEVKAVLPKNDWKAKIRGAAEADEAIAWIKQTIATDPNGRQLIDAYTGLKIDQLVQYAKYCRLLEDQCHATTPTLKEFLSNPK